MLKFETRHEDDLYDLADPKHDSANRVIISKFEGLTKGCVLAYIPVASTGHSGGSFVVWSIYRHNGFKHTTSGSYAMTDGTQSLLAMLVEPNDHNEKALHQAYEAFNDRIASCS